MFRGLKNAPKDLDLTHTKQGENKMEKMLSIMAMRLTLYGELKDLTKESLINLIIELSEDNNLFNDILSNLEYTEEHERYIKNR